MLDTAEDGIVTVNGVEHEPTDRRSSTLQQLPDHQNQSSHFSYIMIHRLISDNLRDVQGYIFAFPLGSLVRLNPSSPSWNAGSVHRMPSSQVGDDHACGEGGSRGASVSRGDVGSRRTRQ